MTIHTGKRILKYFAGNLEVSLHKNQIIIFSFLCSFEWYLFLLNLHEVKIFESIDMISLIFNGRKSSFTNLNTILDVNFRRNSWTIFNVKFSLYFINDILSYQNSLSMKSVILNSIIFSFLQTGKKISCLLTSGEE
jgi:hypothetical protein